jgi:phosphate transport system substrate-binding protein
MLKLKFSLLSATIVAGLVASPAYAVTTFTPTLPLLPAPGPNDGDNSVHGAGATSIQNVLVREMNCVGIDHQRGDGQPGQGGGAATTGALKTVPAGSYVPTTVTPTNPSLTCAGGDTATPTTNIQPNFSGKYVGLGSGFGRRMWYKYQDNFDGAVGSGVANAFNPFNTVGEGSPAVPTARWTHLQFAFSDTPISSGDLANYNTGGTDTATGPFGPASAQGGAAVQFPLFVLPVAIAFNSVYGLNASSVPMTFNAQYDAKFNTVTYKTLRLNRQAYCGIFNGVIKNWNDPILKALNKRTALFDTTNDTSTRWAADGAPIRLVGRLDNSGTTDVFTRHLAAVCSLTGNMPTGTTNVYVRNSENLPYKASSNGAVDYSTVRSDSNYKSGTAQGKFAGDSNLVSGDYYNGTSVVHIDGTSTSPSGAPTGSVGSGLFTLANGGGNIGKFIGLAPDYTLNGVKLNGKIGYISADVISPSPDAAAVAAGGSVIGASLQVGTTGAYAQPAVTSALKAFGAATTQILPPESDTTGAYIQGDTRLVKNAAGADVAATRDNPIAWTDVLYKSPNNTLAAPADGYPIVGTTQFFGYTCYTSGNRQQIVNLLGLALGNVKRNSTATSVSPNTFKGTSPANFGMFSQGNIGIVPAPWVAAIANTFLTNVTTVVAPNTVSLGSKNLWIQDTVELAKSTRALPTPTSNPNPTCASLPGA